MTFQGTLCLQDLPVLWKVSHLDRSQEHVLRHGRHSMLNLSRPSMQCLILVVIQRRMHEHLTTCDWCGITIVPTHATSEYDDHLAECPVLLHFVPWLLLPLTPASHGSRTGGCPQPTQGCSRHAAGLRGIQRRNAQSQKRPKSPENNRQGTLQDAGTIRGHHSISCATEQEKANSCHTREAGAGHAGSSSAYLVGLSGAQQCAATDSGQVEATPVAAVQDGRRAYEVNQKEVDRNGLCMALSTLHLVNDDAQCFVSAVFLTVMCTHLMRSDFNMGSWGLVTTTFLATLMDGTNSPLCVPSHPMLQSGFAQWQQLRGEQANAQQVYSEFLQSFLGRVGSKHVPQTTSRRFSRADEVVIEAKSAVRDPILLYSAPQRVFRISLTSGTIPTA